LNARHKVWALAVLLSCSSAQAAFWDTPPSTVSSTASSNRLKENGYLRVRTSSILKVEPGDPVPADARAAIAEYDRMLSLPMDAIAPEMRAEALRRAADLRVQIADADAAKGEGFHVKEVRRAVAGYNRVLQDYPGHANNDRVLYQLARAHQLINEFDPAVDALMQIALNHPGSVRAADASFRAAEMLFAKQRYAEAQPAYEALLAHGNSTPYFELAQYKYAWSLYKQSQFERAAEVFLGLLDQDLPEGTLEDAAQALAAVEAHKSERASESLRITALCFAALGGGPALSEYFAAQPKPSRMETLVYSALGDALIEKQRYTDAAGTYLAFVERHPDHRRAPAFSESAITAYQRGGFSELATAQIEGYAIKYEPSASYWTNREADAQVLAKVRSYQDDLGRLFQVMGQNASDPAQRRQAYLKAAQWYERSLAQFPDDKRTAQTSLLLADAWLEAGELEKSAQQYERTAYDLPSHAGSPVAALGAVQTWQRLTRQLPAQEQATPRRASIAASQKLGETFPDHPQRSQVLMTAAEDLYLLGDLDEAVTTAERVLASDPKPALQLGALGIIADTRFAANRYEEAEAAYARMLKLPAASGEERGKLFDQMAASVYKQGETARETGDLRSAAQHFQRVASVAPGAAIRDTADFDAASALYELEDWPAAVTALERFTKRYPDHRLLADADKKLGRAYQENKMPDRAAQTFERIARRDTENADTRRVASWTAAELYDEAGQYGRSLQAWSHYVSHYPSPLDEAMQARLRLAQINSEKLKDSTAHRHWLTAMIEADRAAGSSNTQLSRRAAAESSLELGRMDAVKAKAVILKSPLASSLAARKALTESSIRAFEYASKFDFADITSAATFELAAVYWEFSRALLASEPPQDLAGEAAQQYVLLLEEQAYPFEEKAITAHEINLGRVRNGTWNTHIGMSVDELGRLSPAQYAKKERREDLYEQLD
tara:strand:- start:7409 stop:10273 length:2865 start_codon:yes stop_codon:yes gene_type:complete